MSSGFDFSAFIAGFQEEAEERLQSIESTLVDLEQGSLDADRLEKLRRDAHSVKGSANMLQLQDIGESAHVLEDTFAYLRDGSAVPDQAHMNFMFNLLDSLRNRIATAADSAAEQLDPEALREQLENLDSATAEMEAAPAEAEPEATEAEPAVIEPAPEGEGAPPAGEETPTTEEPATGEADGTAAGDEVSAASVDWSRFIPGVREEAHPILSQVQQGLAAEEGIALEAEKLDELERVALSLRQVALEDAAEVLDLVASVLESPASHSLPPALLEVLQGLIQRVRRRLDQADQPGAAPLDRQRIGQARQLLERWGMVPAPGDSAPEGGSAPAEAPAPAASEAAEEEPPAIAEPGQGPTSRTAAPGESNMDVSAFLEGFQAEARELLNVIQDGLLKAEHGDLSRETLDAMKQKAHGLKGSANMLGLEDLGNGAELLEEGFKALTAGGGDGPDYQGLLELHDALRDAAEQVQNPDRPHLDADQWRQRLQRRSPQTTAAPAAESSPDSSPPPSEGAEAPANGDNKPKNSGNRGTMRVSADRLERLSDGVIGLAMDRATQEDRRSDLDQLVADFRSLRQQWEWFEQILPETGPLVEQKKKLSGQLESLNQQLRQFRQQTELDIAARHSLYDEIHQRVMDLMVTPLGNIFSVLPRSARDLAQRFQKRVELTIDGSEIELERRNVDALLEPLVHLVTNAISHGIEDPDERQAAGKDPVGHIRVQARQVGGEVAIAVTDDGRGIDYEKVRETAIRTGVTTAAEAENMLPYDLLQMLFRPGFSTKEEVGQISGRGIGMNAVRDTVQRMTGSIQVDSDVGEGSTFTLNIPVSTAVQRVLKFRVGQEIFGVLANQVDRIMTLQEAVLTETGGQRFFQYQGAQVPATWLEELFNLPRADVQDTMALQLVVVRHLEGYIGLVVHEVLEEAQAVVKDVTGYLRRHAVQGLIGTTISGSGEVQLLLEPTGIKEMERTSPLTLKTGEVWAHDPLKGLRVLLVEDSPLARQMEKAVLENSGMAVDTAVDGLDALDRMEVMFPDIVISDVEMPRMDGYDLLRKLRDDDRYRGVPVFMVTSRDSEEDRKTAQQLGADGFLNKLDLQSGDLIEEIRGRLERLYA